MSARLKAIASSSPTANVVATLRNANAKVHTVTRMRGSRSSGSVNARVKLSRPTNTRQPVCNVLPSAAWNWPSPLSRYSAPLSRSVKVSRASSYSRRGEYT